MMEQQDAQVNSFSEVVLSWRHWWRTQVVGTVDQAAVIEKRRNECELTARYLFMLGMSAGIAVLGLLLSSPAVVIGAMLLSPLMDPIMGLGFALAIGDFRWIRQSAKSLAIGTAMAVALTALVVFMSPLQTITSEIAARTRPNLFDLGVAFFSALAGAYAMIRGREGTVVGVAIATALMPPLAVVGFGLATWNGTVFWGALLLYLTNLLTIALTAWVMARIYGFRTSFSERQTQWQFVAILSVFVLLAVPLGISLRQIAWEARSTQKIRSEISDVFERNSVISSVDLNWESEPIQIAATVFTPTLEPEAESKAARAITREIGKPVDITIIQSRVGQDEDAAEAAQLAAVRASLEAADRQRAEALADRLALVAGVTTNDVVLDRDRRRALVKAKPLPGAALASYRELESRIAATEPEWHIELQPPARPLPNVAFADGKPTGDGAQAIELIAWSSARLNAPVELSGAAPQVRQVADAISQAGGSVRLKNGTSQDGMVVARWGAPGE